MAVTDSTFCFKFNLKDLRSMIPDKDFVITNEFGDVFKFEMLELCETEGKRKQEKMKKQIESNKWQSIHYTGDIATLINYMHKYPMEVSLWKKSAPFAKEGVAIIPWHTEHLNFIKRVASGANPTAVTVNNVYNVFSYNNSRKMATLHLAVKIELSKENTFDNLKQGDRIEDLKDSYYHSLQNMPPSVIYANLLNFVHSLKQHNNNQETIRTIYQADTLNHHNETNGFIVEDITDVKENNEAIAPTTSYKRQKKLKMNRLSAGLKYKSKQIDVEQYLTPIKWLNYVKSDTELQNDKKIKIRMTRSSSLIQNKHSYNILKYILPGDKPILNQIIFVGFMSVQKEESASSSESPVTTNSSVCKAISSTYKIQDGVMPCKENESKYSFKICDPECPVTAQRDVTCTLDIPVDATNLVDVTKCDQVVCDDRLHPIPMEPRDDRILINMANPDDVCCEKSEYIGGVYTKLAIDGLPCECTCSCNFGFVKRTTFCDVCRGIEEIGEDLQGWLINEKPHLCPIYHHLYGKKPKPPPPPEPTKRCSHARMPMNIFEDRTHLRDIESGTDAKKIKKQLKKVVEERFKFNYGFSGIPPQIGHSQCLIGCSGRNAGVPKYMGWLWTSDNIPGLKHRPYYKPGATNRHVARMLRFAKNPNEAKKKKRSSNQEKKKKNEKRPFLIVHKKEGEFTVTMETMKNFVKPRAINQYPYEDKPLISYTVGRTEEENTLRRLRKERKARRLERLQREYLQSAFKDLCAEICLKTYHQALQILPHEEDPPCICYPAEPDEKLFDLENSCSCSENKEWSSSDTDNDEWFIEFTPPTAKYDPLYSPPKIIRVDQGTQYTYLDFRIKKNDVYGNPVPRFFLGPDGKQQCSDLGGFWGPDKKWLEINVDGFVGPDARWFPLNFIGPNNELLDTDNGKITLRNGHTYYVGIHGYVENGRWHFYPKPKEMPTALKKIIEKEKKKSSAAEKRKKESLKEGEKVKKNESKENASKEWSCFGTVSPKELSKLGVMGHGHDRALLLESLKKLIQQGEDVKIPEPSTVPKSPLPENSKKRLNPTFATYEYYAKRNECHHLPPSKKGIVATDALGHKVYFSFRPEKSKRLKERVNHLKQRGISVSSFHLPCFNSFITREMIKNEVNERRLHQTKRKNNNNTSAQFIGKWT